MIWKEIKNFPDYEVSEFGDVRRCKPGKQALVTGQHLKPGVARGGYRKFVLCLGGKAKTVLASRLVVEAFIGPRPFDKAVVCHNDGSRTHDHYSNLRWDSQQANHADMVLHGTKRVGSQKPQAKLIEPEVLEIRRRVARGDVKYRIAEDYNIHPSTISDILAGRTWAHVA